MPTIYEVRTSTVEPLEDAPPGSYSYRPFECDRSLFVSAPVRNTDELAAAIEEAIAIHFTTFESATAAKAWARPRGRHVNGGKRMADSYPMALRPSVAA